MSGSLLPVSQQWFDNNGNPLASGKVFTYIAGTSTLKSTYSDYALSTLNTNPVILDAGGRATIWGNGAYKLIIKDASDNILYTQDNVLVAGNILVGDVSIVGNLTITGNTTATGGLILNSSGVPGVLPVKFTNSSTYSNGDPYGSGSMIVESTGLNNDQPLIFFKYAVNDSTYGNTGPVIWNTGGTGFTTSSNFSATLEMLANNSLVSNFNGKWELGVNCGRDTGDTRKRDGLFYIAPRRSAYNPSGQNTGFEPTFFFLPLSNKGYGVFETIGNGATFTPEYDFGTSSNLTMTNNFRSSLWTNEVTSSTQYARIENYSMGTGYIRSKSADGQAGLYAQSDAANQNALLELRSNWTSAGTGSTIFNMYNVNDNTGFRIQGNGSNGRLNIRYINAGTLAENFDIDPANDGLVTIYQNSDYTKGKIRLSNSAGTQGGGQISYDSNTGIFAITGTDAYFTMAGGIVEPTRITTSAPASAATVTVPNRTTDYIVTSAPVAALTVQLSTTAPPDGHKVTFMCTSAITALTVNGYSGATVLGAPTTLAANGFFTMIYRSATTTWYRNG
jgi:hypothetical protein